MALYAYRVRPRLGFSYFMLFLACMIIFHKFYLIFTTNSNEKLAVEVVLNIVECAFG